MYHRLGWGRLEDSASPGGAGEVAPPARSPRAGTAWRAPLHPASCHRACLVHLPHRGEPRTSWAVHLAGPPERPSGTPPVEREPRARAQTLGLADPTWPALPLPQRAHDLPAPRGLQRRPCGGHVDARHPRGLHVAPGGAGAAPGCHSRLPGGRGNAVHRAGSHLPRGHASSPGRGAACGRTTRPGLASPVGGIRPLRPGHDRLRRARSHSTPPVRLRGGPATQTQIGKPDGSGWRTRTRFWTPSWPRC